VEDSNAKNAELFIQEEHQFFSRKISLRTTITNLYVQSDQGQLALYSKQVLPNSRLQVMITAGVETFGF